MYFYNSFYIAQSLIQDNMIIDMAEKKNKIDQSINESAQNLIFMSINNYIIFPQNETSNVLNTAFRFSDYSDNSQLRIAATRSENSFVYTLYP